VKQIVFFAVEGDLLPVLEAVEQAGAVSYFPMDSSSSAVSDAILRAADIPKLGAASAASSINCDAYLVVERSVSIAIRTVRQTTGVNAYVVDQLENPESVVLTPGGLWTEGVIIMGRVATASDAPMSQALMKRFQRAVKRSFTKIRAFYVGPHAAACMDRGYRLTIASQSPRDLDLAR
jgi:hypothetical protein